MLKPKALLFVHSSNELYGSDKSLLELVRRLDRARYSPLVILPNDLPYQGELGAALNQAGVSNMVVNMAVLRRRYFSPLGITKLLTRVVLGTYHLVRIMRQEKTALVHSNSSAVLCGAFASSLLGIPHIWYVREIVQAPTLVRRALNHLIAWRSTRVVVNSNAVARHLLQDVPHLNERIVVIPPPVDTDRFHPGNDGNRVRREWGLNEKDILFGMVGRIHWWKGQDDFLAAAARVLRHVPHAYFAIVGDVVPGEEFRRDALKAQAAALGIERRVIWAGYRRDIPDVMAALDVLVLASSAPEPFGRVLIEAMATGKPVIATAHGGPLEIVVPEETGLLVPPRSPSHLAAAMIRLAQDAALRQRMGEAALVHVRDTYTLERHVEAFERLYEDMLS